MSIILKFCGAAGTVTGSCYWIRHPQGEFLIDCGMFQGSKTLKELNYGPFPFDPEKLDFVLLTHAHIDHSGMIPKLVKQGFVGPVYATEGSIDLLSYMLPDSGYIHETEVEHLNRRNSQRGKPPVKPIYTRADAEASLNSFRIVDYDRWTDAGDGVRARYWNAGHILGAASIELEMDTGKPDQPVLRLLFSGDIGPDNKLFHPDPEAPEDLDFVFCEATYGGRDRPDVSTDQRRHILADEVTNALKGDGILLIPSFAVERTQELLADLSFLMDDGTVPQKPVFLDSPLAIRATQVFTRHATDLEDMDGKPDLFHHPNIHFTETVDQSKAIGRFTSGCIIMAASGMCDAGRIRHHLKRCLWRNNATVLLVGYQAPGTLGSLLARGVTAVRIQGEEVQVRARIRQIDIYSGHADGDELLDWMAERLPIRQAVYLTHGETSGLTALREGLIQAGTPADRVVIPQLDDEIDLLDGGAGIKVRRAARRLTPEAVTLPDWHNDLAQFSLDLRERLDKCAGDKARNVVLRRLRRALDDNG
jgi:metallo-beta-lactamase family protein